MAAMQAVSFFTNSSYTVREKEGGRVSVSKTIDGRIGYYQKCGDNSAREGRQQTIYPRARR
jgi:hypothetical protein